VELDYSTNLVQAFEKSDAPYKRHVLDALREETGIKVTGGLAGLKMCTETSQNDTVAGCPINDFKDKKEVIVAVQNPQTQA